MTNAPTLGDGKKSFEGSLMDTPSTNVFEAIRKGRDNCPHMSPVSCSTLIRFEVEPLCTTKCMLLMLPMSHTWKDISKSRYTAENYACFDLCGLACAARIGATLVPVMRTLAHHLRRRLCHRLGGPAYRRDADERPLHVEVEP